MRDKENSNARKIIFTGLDNAGKSSIILSLLREISKIAKIKPTKNAERRFFEFLGMNIGEWDLGGHERYRKTYLKESKLIFGGTDIVIYVIDVQDKERIVDSCAYLNDIIKQFIKLKLEPPIHVFFHKNDPDLVEPTQNIVNDTFSYLKNKIQQFQNYEKFFFYRTTIFDLPTITNAMSEILLTLFLRADVIDTTVREFAEKNNIEGVELIDDNSLIIGSYYKNEEIKHILNSLSPYFLRLNDGFEKMDYMEYNTENHTIVQRFGKYFLFKRFSLAEGAYPYYLLLYKDDSSFYNEEFLALQNLLNEILSHGI